MGEQTFRQNLFSDKKSSHISISIPFLPSSSIRPPPPPCVCFPFPFLCSYGHESLMHFSANNTPFGSVNWNPFSRRKQFWYLRGNGLPKEVVFVLDSRWYCFFFPWDKLENKWAIRERMHNDIPFPLLNIISPSTTTKVGDPLPPPLLHGHNKQQEHSGKREPPLVLPLAAKK